MLEYKGFARKRIFAKGKEPFEVIQAIHEEMYREYEEQERKKKTS